MSVVFGASAALYGRHQANPTDLLRHDRFPVYETKRGGEYTYHGPGQRVVYLMLDLRKRGRDVRCFVRQAENWIIQTLDDFNIKAHITPGRIGVWVPRPDKGKPAKIKLPPSVCAFAAGSAFTAFPSMLSRILSISAALCRGISDQSVTSMVDLGYPVSMAELDKALVDNFDACFPATD